MNRFSRSMPREEAAPFIQGMYAAAGSYTPSEEQAIEEWTDRLLCVRSRYTQGEVVVFTHGMSAADDHLPLPTAIQDYLADYDKQNLESELITAVRNDLTLMGWHHSTRGNWSQENLISLVLTLTKEKEKLTLALIEKSRLSTRTQKSLDIQVNSAIIR